MMATKLIVITGEGGAPEDGSVYYSRFVIVSSDTLAFDEAIFTDEDHPIRKEDDALEYTQDERYDAVVAEMKSLGYSVETPETEYIEVQNG